MLRFRFLSLPAVIVLGALAQGCSSPNDPPGGNVEPRVLQGFEGCDDMLAYVKDHAKDMIDEYGNLHGYDYSNDGGWFGEGDPAGEGGTAGDSGGGEEGGGGDDLGGDVPQDGKDYSGTNVQEVGVDEPDVVKTDGERILAVARGKLHFIAADGAAPELRGSLELGADVYDAQLFMHEDRALVLLRAYSNYYWEGEGDSGGEPVPAGQKGPDFQKYFGENFYGSVLRLVEVDISDPDALKIVSNLYVTGDLVSARMVGGVSRIVVRSSMTGVQVKDPYEFFDDAAYTAEVGWENYNEEIYKKYWDKALEQSKVHNKAVIEATTAKNWLPQYLQEDLSGGAAKYTSGLLLDCDRMMHASEFSGLSTLSVLTVDLAANLSPGDGVGLFSEGETVYASKENLYVSTTPWRWQNWSWSEDEPQPSDGVTSFVHKFDISQRSRADYVASGAVRGWLNNQWAMSEHKGDLRVATTDQLGWDQETSESFVTVLRQQGDDLEEIGQVGGLGKTEQIQGVRFIGDVGYVVTFRQTDPLYTIDVSDPTKPVAVGELKIPGFSTYLHPVGEGLLLGVGRDGTEEGQVLGMQLSLFDVSDLKNPLQIHKATFGSDWGWSEALFDHKAFLYWGKSQLAMLPMEWGSWDGDVYDWNAGAFGFTVDAEDGIQMVGEVNHPEPEGECGEFEEYYCYYSPSLRRSFVIGEHVYTLSDLGLKASTLAGLGDAHWVEFPQDQP